MYPGKTPEPKDLLFSSLARSFELKACLKTVQLTSNAFCFSFIIACHAMFSESLLIYYLFHFFPCFPFFACRSSCSSPSSNPLFPSVDTTATTEPAVHGWYHIPVYLLSQHCWEARQAWEKEKCSLQRKWCFTQPDLRHRFSFQRLERTLSCHFCCEFNHHWLLLSRGMVFLAARTPPSAEEPGASERQIVCFPVVASRMKATLLCWKGRALDFFFQKGCITLDRTVWGLGSGIVI